MAEDRKPNPTRKPAQEVLNKFLLENDILIGTDSPKIEFTPSGAMMVYPPRIIAAYKNDAQGPKTPPSKTIN